jgi:hypothetical protein
MSGADYNSQLMSSLHKQGGKGTVNTTLLGGRDPDTLKKLFGDPIEALKGMHADAKLSEGEKGFSQAGQNTVFNIGDPKGFGNQQGQQPTFSQAGQQSTFTLAGQGSMFSTANYHMNPLIQHMGRGLGFAQMMVVRPISDVQGIFLGQQGFLPMAGNMSMSGRMNFPSFGISNASFSSAGGGMGTTTFSSGGGGGGSSSALAASGGGGAFARGLPTIPGATFGGNVSQAALGQMSARSSAPMNISLGGADISIG